MRCFFSLSFFLSYHAMAKKLFEIGVTSSFVLVCVHYALLSSTDDAVILNELNFRFNMCSNRREKRGETTTKRYESKDKHFVYFSLFTVLCFIRSYHSILYRIFSHYTPATVRSSKKSGTHRSVYYNRLVCVSHFLPE